MLRSVTSSPAITRWLILSLIGGAISTTVGCRDGGGGESSQYIGYGLGRGSAIVTYNAVALESDGTLGLMGASVNDPSGSRRGLVCQDVVSASPLLQMDPSDPAFGDPPGAALDDPQLASYLWFSCENILPSATGLSSLGGCAAQHLDLAESGDETLFIATAVVDGELISSSDGDYEGWFEATGDETLFVGGAVDSTTPGAVRFFEFSARPCS
jgi:hypothetical protein